MKQNYLAHVADKVINRPLLIMPDKLAIISQVIEGRIGIDASDLVSEQTQAALPAAARGDGKAKRKPYAVTDDGVAVIPVLGSLINRGSFLDTLSGMTSYQTIKGSLAQAAADDDVRSIVLEIDSPGGEAIGAFEVGDAVALAAQSKPVTAHASGLCCSAAYAIASRADRLISAPSAVVGSIGVVMLHMDYSTAIHNAGIKPTLIHAGARKVDGNPYQPLTDDVAASLKSEVETFMDLFVSNVAQGRTGLSPEAIRATEARTYIGAKAVDVGLADAVGSFESVIAESSRVGFRPSQIGAKTMTDTVTAEAHRSAVDAARAEGFAAGKSEGITEGKTAGATAERERFKAVAASENYKGREAAAHHALMSTDMNAEAIGGLLAGLPAATVATAALPEGRSKDASGGLATVNGGPDAKANDTANMTEFQKGLAAVKSGTAAA